MAKSAMNHPRRKPRGIGPDEINGMIMQAKELLGTGD